jgi:hypothetical protein
MGAVRSRFDAWASSERVFGVVDQTLKGSIVATASDAVGSGDDNAAPPEDPQQE